MAEWVAVPVGQLLPVPDGLSLTQAAALPEAALTSWTNLVAEGRLAPGETVLIAGATSGIGLFAVQLARELGARVVAAGRTRERVERLRELGADEVCVFGDGFLDAVRQASGGRGVDLVMDLVGGAWFSDHLRVLRREGRLVLVGLMAGGRAEVDLGVVLMRRLEVRGSVLRSRPVGEKAALVGDFWAFAGERLGDGRLRGVVDRVVSLDSVREGYLAMLAGGLWGKIVVEVGGV